MNVYFRQAINVEGAFVLIAFEGPFNNILCVKYKLGLSSLALPCGTRQSQVLRAILNRTDPGQLLIYFQCLNLT